MLTTLKTCRCERWDVLLESLIFIFFASQEAQLVQKMFKFLFQMLVHKDVSRMLGDAEGKSFSFVSTLTSLVEKCLALVEEKPNPLGYLQLLLYLFKLLHKFKLLFQVIAAQGHVAI